MRQAFDEVIEAARRHHPAAQIDGVLVSRQVVPSGELIVGAKRDASFGPVVVAGVGGVLVEIIRDAALRLPPLDAEAALAMLGELRTRPAGDLAAAAAALVAVGELALDLGDRLVALDVNPLFVMPEGEGVLAGDALVVLT